MENIKNELEHLVEKFKKDYNYYKHSHSYNENNCRLEFIDKFFGILGWDISNEQCKSPQYREVITENYNADTGRPDYSMTLNGVPKFHVEAKKPSVSIEQNSEPAFQARKYGWNSKLKISVLTNFEYLMIYDTTILPKEGESPKTAALKMYHYSEYVDNIEEIYKLISKKSVYNGDFENVLDLNGFKIHDKGLKLPVDEYFLRNINEWRVNIGNYLYKEKKYDIDFINDYIQEFINQVVFLRICEDRKLPTYHNLKEVLEEKELIKEMDKLFREADKKYNSGIFSGENLIFDLNNEIIKDVVEELYYPKSPYQFNLIQANILGEIYELFLAEKLIIENGEITLQNKEKNEHRDVVTTPVEIVKYMVDRVLKEVFNGKTPTEVLDIKIADIACGSGIFLIETYDWIIQYVTSWYVENDIDHLMDMGNNLYKLPFEDKKRILENCIWGIDIDIHAVEVAKFNLILKLLEMETEPSLRNKEKLLPDLIDNIKYGNSLIDYGNISYDKLSDKDKSEIVPFNWNNINQGELFDVIIGNPPYVSTEDMKNLLNKKELKVYKDRYNTSKGQYDKYFMFVERALEKVKVNGIVSYIIPNKFAKIKSGEAMRNLLAKSKFVKEYVDFGSLQLFKERNKTVYSSILQLQKSKNSKFNYVEVDNLSKWFSKIDCKEIEVESDVLGSLPWALATDQDDMGLINKIYSNSIPLGSEADIFNGIQTSAERPPIYWFTKSEILKEDNECFTVQKFDKVYKIEKDILKKYFKPVLKSERNLGSYDPYNTDKYIIFPYDHEGKLYVLDIMKDKFPNTFYYLLDNYDELQPKQIGGRRRDVPLATADTWYQYGRDQALTAFNNKKKLIVGVLSKNAMYLYDDNDLVIASGGTAGYCAIAKNEASNYELEFLQAYLTHPYAEKLLSIIGSDFEGGYYSRGTNVLDRFPLKKIDFNNENQKSTYDNIILKVRRVNNINNLLNGVLTKSQKSILMDEKKYLIKTIEELVSVIYNI